MPTTEEQLANAVASFDALTQTVAGEVALWQAERAAAIAAVPNLSRIYRVDAVNGDDANDGLSAANALATLEKAIALAPMGGFTVIRLLSDVHMTARANVTGSKYIAVQGWNSDDTAHQRRKITVAGVASNDANTIAGIAILTASHYDSYQVDYELPVADAGVGFPQFFRVEGFSGIRFYLADFTLAAGANTQLIRTGVGQSEAWIQAYTAAAGMPGHWFSGVAAGADPNADWHYRSSLTSA